MDAGMRVTIVQTFAHAREQLQRSPHLLISEVRLGDYNGLHLALRARSSGIPAIVVGKGEDAVLEREAHKLGAIYVPFGGDLRRLRAAIRDAGIDTSPAGRADRRKTRIHAA